jgi:hypothetical protein
MKVEDDIHVNDRNQRRIKIRVGPLKTLRKGIHYKHVCVNLPYLTSNLPKSNGQAT